MFYITNKTIIFVQNIVRYEKNKNDIIAQVD